MAFKLTCCRARLPNRGSTHLGVVASQEVLRSGIPRSTTQLPLSSQPTSNCTEATVGCMALLWTRSNGPTTPLVRCPLSWKLSSQRSPNQQRTPPLQHQDPHMQPKQPGNIHPHPSGPTARPGETLKGPLSSPQQPPFLQPTHLVAPPPSRFPASAPKPAVEGHPPPTAQPAPGQPGTAPQPAATAPPVAIGPARAEGHLAPAEVRAVLPSAALSLEQLPNGRDPKGRFNPSQPSVTGLMPAVAHVPAGPAGSAVQAAAPGAPSLFSQPIPVVTTDQHTPR